MAKTITKKPVVSNGSEISKTSHYVQIDESSCNGCVLCMKVCPTKAIRVRDHRLAYIEGVCIDCGECIRVCPRGAIKAITTGSENIDRSRAIISTSPVLFTQFSEGVTPDQIILALKNMGFFGLEDQRKALEMVSIAIQLYVRENRNRPEAPRPLISPICPVVVQLIAYRFPSLLKNIPPIMIPRQLAAREAKKKTAREHGLKEDDIKVFHITPCPAKMMCVKNPLFGGQSYLDGAIGIKDIYGEIMKQLPLVDKDAGQHHISGVWINWGRSGGEIAGMEDGNFLAVSGMGETIRYLQKIEMGLLDNIDYVEFRTCPEGCIGGPLNVADRYEAKHTIHKLIQILGVEKKLKEEYVKGLYDKGWFSAVEKIEPLEHENSRLDLSEAIKRQKRVEEIYRILPGKECGICGSPDCLTFAEDVVDKRMSLDNCPFLEFCKENGG